MVVGKIFFNINDCCWFDLCFDSFYFFIKLNILNYVLFYKIPYYKIFNLSKNKISNTGIIDKNYYFIMFLKQFFLVINPLDIILQLWDIKSLVGRKYLAVVNLYLHTIVFQKFLSNQWVKGILILGSLDLQFDRYGVNFDYSQFT